MDYYADWSKITLITPLDKQENINFYTKKCDFIVNGTDMDGNVRVVHFIINMENQGIATALVNKVIDAAANNKCAKIKLITTNDNINALRFYQKRGFDMVKLYHNALDTARKLKPSIPLLGEFDIPLKHEIEFEIRIDLQSFENLSQ